MFSDKLTNKIAELDFNKRGLLFAELSRVAYFTEYHATRLAKKLGFTTVEFYNIDGAEAYRFMNKRDMVFACRGTQPKQFNDIKADARAFPVVAETIGRVHGGFKGEVDKLWDKIQEDILREQHKRNLWFTGHSLGAAMSTILASRSRGELGIVNPVELHTYGSPRVGWKNYINHFPIKHYRWVNNADIVTRVPFWFMGYRHHGICKYFNHWGNLRNITGWQRTKDVWRGIFKGIQNLKFDSVADHNPKEYIKHIKKMVDGKETHQPSFIDNYAHMYER